MSANLQISSDMAKSCVDYTMSVIQGGNNVQTMTSLQIAEITGKRHSDVMRAIRTMEDAWSKVNGRNFALVEYTDAKGEKRPCYSLTKTECLYIATKFNDEARAKLVLRWETLERAEAERHPNVPTTFKEALLLAVAQQEQIEQQQALIAEQAGAISEMQPKVSYCDIILQSPSTVTVTQIAQDYGKSAKAFNKLLHTLGIQRKVGRQWVLYSQYIANGYVQSATEPMRNSNTGRTYTYSKWTQKGRIFLYNELKNRGVLPLIEQI